jgi:hypothetical protein
MRYMCGNDIDEVVELWKNVYPEAFGSTHQFVFDSQWYEGNVLFGENWKADAKKKKYAIILLEDLKESQLVGILLMTKWDQNLQVEFTMGGLHSAFPQGESTCGDFVDDQMGSKPSGRVHHGWTSFRIPKN